eukprot:5429730-Pyramimonas_sp.AAC.1
MGLAVRATAACVPSGQKAACPTAAAVASGQHHLLLGIVPILSVPISGVQIERRRSVQTGVSIWQDPAEDLLARPDCPGFALTRVSRSPTFPAAFLLLLWPSPSLWPCWSSPSSSSRSQLPWSSSVVVVDVAVRV